MSCSDFEILVLESLDGALPAEKRGALDAHLKTCPACREFMQAQRALDASLSRDAASAPVMSPDFRRRLQRRIALEESAPGRGSAWLPELLEIPAYAAAALAAGLALTALGKTGVPGMPLPQVSSAVLMYGTAALALAAGFFTAFRQGAFARKSIF